MRALSKTDYHAEYNIVTLSMWWYNAENHALVLKSRPAEQLIHTLSEAPEVTTTISLKLTTPFYSQINKTKGQLKKLKLYS